MRKLWIGAVLGLLFLGSCAQNKEKREEYKDAHDKDSLRNRMGDSAVANSIPSPTASDTSKVKTDSTKIK
ncbi:hypothetical protein J2795_000822 [Chryseobacterium bernardetii]|jgi:hypothetical protein|uniref:Lipoprotein n=3 Tax=Chryseobacterium TaxID=59732 RepID=A0A543ELT8_9FLAO|nr:MULTISPECIES: hypothetical protein [Chryseobacterium]MDR6368940.1 hypothetical protein [Chryseobacterium vietnamense]MDR6440137.1 hypothetical protein [Chryseobacterium bernardetii]MDR6459733.1 hypothetical protein [Chryseobacterium vietnamense]MDR6489206.1 hypothetical protein [Chryseobacterium vietnamense]TQM22551.1 hypothetical protein FB551_2264 [Chryseobacterium aquifrigidense]